MTSFASIIERGTNRVYARFGQTAIYHDKLGASMPVVVVVERNLAQYGQIAAVQGKSIVINVRASDLPTAPRRTEIFILESGEVLTVDALLSSDGVEHKVVAA